MNKPESEEIPSYRDPMGARVEAARKRKELYEAEFPPVREAYDGFYLRLNTLGEEGARYLLGAEGIIGSPLRFDNEHIALLASDGTCIASLQGADRERLAQHAEQGWNIQPFVCMTFYSAESKHVGADIAFICWAPLSSEQEASLSTFAHNIAERLASGDRAELHLTQEQFIKVLESKGAWYLTQTTKREPLEKGSVVYKARRTGVERITAFSLRHRMGCSILATLFWVLVVAGIVVLVVTLFF